MTPQQALDILGLVGTPDLSKVDTEHRARIAEADSEIQDAEDESTKHAWMQRKASLNEAYSILMRRSLGDTAGTKSPYDSTTAGQAAFQSPSGLSATKLADLPGAHPYQTALGTGGNISQIASLQPGHVLANRFEIKAQIGAGGMGAVYRAHDRNRGEDIALKVMLPGLISSDVAKQRFMNEAKIAIKLGHQHIVNTYDVQMDGAYIFITMELLQGQSLRQAMNDKKARHDQWSEQEILNIIKPLCEALSYAHKYTIHRDIKPENIWISQDGSIKLMDFGIARLMTDSQMTQTSAVLGTAYYMAPEQLTGAKGVDHRADQYSVGVLVYELLAESIPSGRFKPISEIRDDISQGLSDAVDKALAGHPEDRYENMEDFAQGLQETGKVRKKTAQQFTNTKKRDKEREARGGMLKLAGGGFALIMLLGGGYFYFGNKSSTTQPLVESASNTQAKQHTQDQKKLPPRPKLPFNVDEDIWRTIESSEAYRNLPVPRSSKINYQSTSQIEFTGSASRSLPSPAPSSVAASRVTTALGGKCIESQMDLPLEGMSIFSCGVVIQLGMMQTGKNPLTVIKSIKLEGSLFPMRVGASVSVQGATAYLVNRDLDSKYTMTAKVVGHVKASDLSSKLTGGAWRIHFETTSSVKGTVITQTQENYYLEDEGIFLSEIGKTDWTGTDAAVTRVKYVLPSPGSKTVMVTHGDYGSNTTNIFKSYSWKIGN